MSLNIVLFEPEIPQNTGNIARTSAATGINLHLIKPLGFSISDKQVKRAGLDYWDLVNIKLYNSIYEIMEKYHKKNFYFSTTKGKHLYTDIEYPEETFIVFGKETAGLPDFIHKNYSDRTVRIPMVNIEKARSLNLSNAVAVIGFEILRQHSFKNLF